tara:strand:+ start:730 stop:2388 length:1659 start_codon:yes stop_codon:yes gene_type:complete
MNINQYNQMFGRQMTSEEIQAFQIHSMALGSLINNAVFENEFDSQNFIIDETIVASETKKRFPNLYNNNKLNDKELNSFLKQQRLKIEDLVKIINYETRSNIFDELFLNVSYPNKFQKIINKHNNHFRNVDFIKLDIDKYELSNFESLDISINNQKIIDYFNQNIDLYMDPEKRDISYLLIDKDDYVDQLTPGKNQIEDYYNSNKSLFLEPEKRDFIQFNFKNLEEAKKFKNTTVTFNSNQIINFAKENNITFNNFESLSKDEVLEELSDVIFNLQPNFVSSVVETTLAKHLIIVSKIYPEFQNSLEQSRDEIVETLLEVELNNFISDLKNNINQQILDGFSLKEISQNYELKIKNIYNAERAFENIQDDFVKSEVIAKAFSSNKDFVSDIEMINKNQSVIFNVDDIIYEKPYELNQVFDKVSQDWINSLKIQEIDTYLNKSISKSNTLEDLSLYFKEEISNVDLKFSNDDFPSIFKNEVFKSVIDKIYFSVANKNIYIAKTNKVTFPSDDNLNNEDLNLGSELRGVFGAEIVKNKKISTNDNLIQALISQY